MTVACTEVIRRGKGKKFYDGTQEWTLRELFWRIESSCSDNVLMRLRCAAVLWIFTLGLIMFDVCGRLLLYREHYCKS